MYSEMMPSCSQGLKHTFHDTGSLSHLRPEQLQKRPPKLKRIPIIPTLVVYDFFLVRFFF